MNRNASFLVSMRLTRPLFLSYLLCDCDLGELPKPLPIIHSTASLDRMRGVLRSWMVIWWIMMMMMMCRE